jgi:predicted RNA-binding protein Jag
MTTSTKAKKITQTWDIKRLQEEAIKIQSHKIASTMHVLKKHPGKEITEMEKVSAHITADMLKNFGVKTPLDLVKYLADFEVNMFGSEASTSGDAKCAVLINEKPAVWLETLRTNTFSENQIESMQEHFSSFMKHLGHGLGFKAHVDFAEDGKSSKITFTEK